VPCDAPRRGHRGGLTGDGERTSIAGFGGTMTTLVTGATGLVGHAIVRSLRSRDRSVRVLARSVGRAEKVVPSGCEIVEGDVTDADSMRAAAEGCEVVYHAAGLPEQWLSDATIFDRVNVGGTRNAIDAAREHGARRFVYTSTIDVFRAGPGESFDESEIDPEPKGTYYERSKQEADRVVVAAVEDGFDAVLLHPAAVYGPGPAGSPGINDFVRRLLHDEAPGLLPGGMPVVYSGDVGEAHVRAEERAERGARYILSDRYVTLQEIARIVSEKAGTKVPRTLPLWAAKAASVATESWAVLSGKAPLIPSGQLHFMQWGARPRADRAREDLDLDFVPVEEGVSRLLDTLDDPGAG